LPQTDTSFFHNPNRSATAERKAEAIANRRNTLTIFEFMPHISVFNGTSFLQVAVDLGSIQKKAIGNFAENYISIYHSSGRFDFLSSDSI
jgi:ribosomal protein S19